ncbi:unnamed protein product [Arabidopsis thaliana]|uniref:Uncharacterized protein n=1 Tax=Arabidopsis thaliana TaxID=3702 RepID=A0A5S9X5D6_ARATH|nr:unnamed protein product [Arabidopsis thaliana]
MVRDNGPSERLSIPPLSGLCKFRRTLSQKDDNHYCYLWMVSSALEYVRKFGIEKEPSRPFHAYAICPKDVPHRSPSIELSYISEVVWLNRIEDDLCYMNIRSLPVSPFSFSNIEKIRFQR